MKILYIGSICNESEFEATNSRSRLKVSSAPQHFEAAILKGLSSVQDLELPCISAECIATFPNGTKFYLSERRDDLGNGLTTNIHENHDLHTGIIKKQGLQPCLPSLPCAYSHNYYNFGVSKN